MTRNELADLDREALIDLILALQAEVEALRLKLEKMDKPPTNLGNSSQPPSKDWKGNLPTKRRRRRHGPPLGHEKHEREFIAKPDHIVEVKAKVCEHCQTDLCQQAWSFSTPFSKRPVLYTLDKICCSTRFARPTFIYNAPRRTVEAFQSLHIGSIPHLNPVVWHWMACGAEEVLLFLLHDSTAFCDWLAGTDENPASLTTSSRSGTGRKRRY